MKMGLITLFVIFGSLLLAGCVSQQNQQLPQPTFPFVANSPVPTQNPNSMIPASIGSILVSQISSQNGGATINAQLASLSTSDNGAPLTQVVWDWGDCLLTTASDSSLQTHNYAVFTRGSVTCVSGVSSAATLYAYTIAVTAVYSDGKHLTQTYVLPVGGLI